MMTNTNQIVSHNVRSGCCHVVGLSQHAGGIHVHVSNSRSDAVFTLSQSTINAYGIPEIDSLVHVESVFSPGFCPGELTGHIRQWRLASTNEIDNWAAVIPSVWCPVGGKRALIMLDEEVARIADSQLCEFLNVMVQRHGQDWMAAPCSVGPSFMYPGGLLTLSVEAAVAAEEVMNVESSQRREMIRTLSLCQGLGQICPSDNLFPCQDREDSWRKRTLTLIEPELVQLEAAGYAMATTMRETLQSLADPRRYREQVSEESGILADAWSCVLDDVVEPVAIAAPIGCRLEDWSLC